jgi:hypothetical protein
VTVGRALSLLITGTHMTDFKGGSVSVARDALFVSTKAGFVDADLAARAARTPFMRKAAAAAAAADADAAPAVGEPPPGGDDGGARSGREAEEVEEERELKRIQAAGAKRGAPELMHLKPAEVGGGEGIAARRGGGGRPLKRARGPLLAPLNLTPPTPHLPPTPLQIGDYCIHPACIRASVERSLERLRLETVGPHTRLLRPSRAATFAPAVALGTPVPPPPHRPRPCYPPTPTPPNPPKVDLVYLHNVAEVLAPRGVARKDVAAAMEAAFGELEALRRWGAARRGRRA